MSAKLTIRAIAERLATRAGLPADVAEDFIKRYFKAIEKAVIAGESVEAVGLGIFTRDGVEVRLEPDPSLAEELNEPFSFFESVRVNDGVTDEMLSRTGESSKPAPESKPQPEHKPEPNPEPQPEHQPEHQPEPEPEPEVVITTIGTVSEPETKAESQTPVIHSVADTQEPEQIRPCPPRLSESEEEYRRIERAGNHTAIWAVGCLLLGLVVGGLSGWWFGRYCPETVYENPEAVTVETVTETETESSAALSDSDETAAAPAIPDSLTPIAVDTVRIGYVYTHMAKKYYGDKNFWSYIYEENASKLGHPEHLRPGTVLVIPNPKKYHIDASNPESVSASKRLAYDIYARFR